MIPIRIHVLINCACLIAVTAAVAGPLQDYVEKPDNSYAYEILKSQRTENATLYVVKMTSQTWQEITWWHWMLILVPDVLEHDDKAILIIGGGRNREKPPSIESDRARPITQMLSRTGAIYAYLGQVPNQPLFDGLREDALIAHTFDKYIDGGDDTWPLLLPMVKSAVRAMDTIQAIADKQLNKKIDGFVVTGASKRGWTTWLTGAMDNRVVGIAPMVIDMLNLEPQLAHQIRSYGRYSEQIGDYTNLDIPKKMQTEAGRRLTAIVDPFVYRDRITMAKLVLLGTNDRFWTVDAANFYFPQLIGDKYLYYVANAGHSLNYGITVMPTVLGFIKAALNGSTLPRVNWSHDPDGALQVTWQGDGSATLWQADSPNRDFRDAQWRPTPLEGDGQCRVKIDALPQDQGWIAYYVEVRSNLPGQGAFGQTTTITVLPKTMPHALPDDRP